MMKNRFSIAMLVGLMLATFPIGKRSFFINFPQDDAGCPPPHSPGG